jgi:predicted ATPase
MGSIMASQNPRNHCLEAYCEQGITLWYLGEFSSALLHLERGIAHYDPLRRASYATRYWHDSSVSCLSFAARTLWFLGYPAQALMRSQEALSLARQLSQPYLLAAALHFAASLHIFRQEAQLAQELAEAAITLSRAHGFTRWLSGGLIRRGWAMAQLGSVEEGIREIQEGMETWRDTGAKVLESQHLAMVAEAYKNGGQAECGLRTLDEALTIMRANEERHWEAELYRLRGELLLEAGQEQGHNEAEMSFLRALEVARQQSAKSLELRAVMSLSCLWQKQGKREKARQMLTGIYDWFSEGSDTLDLQRARAILEIWL